MRTDPDGEGGPRLLHRLANEPRTSLHCSKHPPPCRAGRAMEMQSRVDTEVALLQVQQKLTGSDERSVVSVESRVRLLVQQSTDVHMLALMPADWQAWL